MLYWAFHKPHLGGQSLWSITLDLAWRKSPSFWLTEQKQNKTPPCTACMWESLQLQRCYRATCRGQNEAIAVAQLLRCCLAPSVTCKRLRWHAMTGASRAVLRGNTSRVNEWLPDPKHWQEVRGWKKELSVASGELRGWKKNVSVKHWYGCAWSETLGQCLRAAHTSTCVWVGPSHPMGSFLCVARLICCFVTPRLHVSAHVFSQFRSQVKRGCEN